MFLSCKYLNEINIQQKTIICALLNTVFGFDSTPAISIGKKAWKDQLEKNQFLCTYWHQTIDLRTYPLIWAGMKKHCTALLTQCVSPCSACQQQLPATGVPITRQRFDHMRQKFREYVQAQTLQNWKFWIVSLSMWIWFIKISHCHKTQSQKTFLVCIKHYNPSIPVWGSYSMIHYFAVVGCSINWLPQTLEEYQILFCSPNCFKKKNPN